MGRDNDLIGIETFVVGPQFHLIRETGIERSINRGRCGGKVLGLGNQGAFGRVDAHTVSNDIIDGTPRHGHRGRLKHRSHGKILRSGDIIVGLDQPRSKSRTVTAGIVGTDAHRVCRIGGKPRHGVARRRNGLLGFNFIEGVTHLYGVALGSRNGIPGHRQGVEGGGSGLDVVGSAKADNRLGE